MSTKVFVPDVLEALELATDETSSYIHEASGRVVTLSHEDLRLAEDLEGDTSTLPDWQKNTVAEALDVLASEHWLQLPSKRDLHEWEFMDDFARTVVDPVRRGELADAIRGRGAFRRFKGTVRRLGLEDAWYAYRASALDRIAREAGGTWIRRGRPPSGRGASGGRATSNGSASSTRRELSMRREWAQQADGADRNRGAVDRTTRSMRQHIGEPLGRE